MKKTIALITAAAVLLLFLPGCAAEKLLPENVAGVYSKTGSVFSNTRVFSIRLEEDGTFSFTESGSNEPVCTGSFGIKRGIVTLKYADPDDEENSLSVRFRFEDDKLIFVEEGSDSFPYANLKDGVVFDRKTEQPHGK